MATKRPGSSFADIVADARAAPRRASRTPVGPSHDGATWGDPDGNEYRCVADGISPQRAVELVRQDPLVVWDPCGCGTRCGTDLVWLTADERSVLKTVAPPRIGSKNTWGTVSEWRLSAGTTLLVAAINVSWGDRITG